MALNIKHPRVERLTAELSRMTGETKTETIRRALEERRARLKGPSRAQRRARVLALLEQRIWTEIPAAQRGRRLSHAEEDAILGYGPEGV